MSKAPGSGSGDSDDGSGSGDGDGGSGGGDNNDDHTDNELFFTISPSLSFLDLAIVIDLGFLGFLLIGFARVFVKFFG